MTAFGISIAIADSGRWNSAIGGGTIAYRSLDDARIAVRSQQAKWNLPIGTYPCPLPPTWGIFLPSAGHEATYSGAWLEPHDDDGVESALVFTSADEANEVLERRRNLTASSIPWDAFVAPFAWDSTPKASTNEEATR